ncbi:chorismate synthase [Ruminococcaceae bacterium OttesenSCG-928-L11]|nr:chorismate synthase [Ruminococcaceae bacterium OttesenSCG-928-L11]MDL2233486.1 chorismate synthase [Ruminococcaceae bacterium OttesenSCG-928-L11]
MASTWGNTVKISIFGESHGKSIGVVLDGLPAGVAIDQDAVREFMARRAPGTSEFATARREEDRPEIQSGLWRGKTTGTPLCAVIANADTRSADYSDMEAVARPGHADYTGFLRYSGHNDVRGGGHFSGRLTAPLVFAGAVAVQILAQRGIAIGGHIQSIEGCADDAPDSLSLTPEALLQTASRPFPVFSAERGATMQEKIRRAREEGDSVGGVVQCFALGVPGGIGSPMFDGVENRVASLLFGVPAVKGVEFGSGFAAAEMRGSQHNDAFRIQDGAVVTETNRHGGILGGIATGMPIVVRAAFKPTPSIALTQKSVEYVALRDTDITVKGRHDPCIVPRAVPCVEACVALALLDLM